MTSKMVYAFNELTRVVKQVPAHYLDHPTLGKNLVLVADGRKRGRLSEIVGTPTEPTTTAPADEPPAVESADEDKED